MVRVRIDRLLVERGLAPSRERARAMLLAGSVLVDEKPVTKAGAAVDAGAAIRLKEADHPFVSRGGVKLEGALEDLAVDVEGKAVLDVGASTGGFTDACLRRKAARVFAVDVGTNQLDYRLRTDPRVFSLEKTNARNLAPGMLPGPADIAVIDVSFISAAKILAPVIDCLAPDGAVLLLVKPQFEAGRDKVGKGGVVRDEAVREEAIDRVIRYAETLNLRFVSRAEARLKGPKGNQETFVYFKKR